MVSDVSDPGGLWPTAAPAGIAPEGEGFSLRWRMGTRFGEHGEPVGATAEIDLREGIDLRAVRRTWEHLAARDVLDRMVFRLVGDAEHTRTLVDRVLGSAATVDVRRVVTEALGLVLEHQGPLGEVHILRVDGATFGDHRRRLCRELLRWPAAPRVALALRHLGEIEVDEIAAVMDWPVDDVRDVIAAWWPEERPNVDHRAANPPLRHLDPVGRPLRA